MFPPLSSPVVSGCFSRSRRSVACFCALLFALCLPCSPLLSFAPEYPSLRSAHDFRSASLAPIYSPVSPAPGFRRASSAPLYPPECHHPASAVAHASLPCAWRLTSGRQTPAALSLPRRGPPRFDPTPISELLDTRNALRTRNRELSGLTATPSLPPSSNRRPRSPLLPPPLSQAAPSPSTPRTPSPPLSTSDVHSVLSEARGDSYFDDSDEASQATPSHASLSSSFSTPSVGNSDVHPPRRQRTRRRPNNPKSHRKRHQ